MNCIFWQDAFMSWGGPWGLLPPSPKELSLEEPHWGWESWRKGPLNQPQWRPHKPPMLERRPATSPEKSAAPSAEEPDVPATASGEPSAELTRGPAASTTPPKTDKKVKVSLPCELPGWTQIHSSCLVTPVGESLQVWVTWGSTARVAVLMGEGPNVIRWKNKGEVDRGTPVQLHHMSPLCLTPLWKIHQKSHCMA